MPGLKQEGALRELAREGIGFEDAVLMTLLRNEWESGRPESKC